MHRVNEQPRVGVDSVIQATGGSAIGQVCGAGIDQIGDSIERRPVQEIGDDGVGRVRRVVGDDVIPFGLQRCDVRGKLAVEQVADTRSARNFRQLDHKEIVKALPDDRRDLSYAIGHVICGIDRVEALEDVIGTEPDRNQRICTGVQHGGAKTGGKGGDLTGERGQRSRKAQVHRPGSRAAKGEVGVVLSGRVEGVFDIFRPSRAIGEPAPEAGWFKHAEFPVVGQAVAEAVEAGETVIDRCGAGRCGQSDGDCGCDKCCLHISPQRLPYHKES